jgi:hypothetical protein
MHDPTKMDYSKLLGFDTVSDQLENGIDFQDPTVGAKLGAKVGRVTTVTKGMKLMDLPSDVAGPGGPVMRGLRGRRVTGA